VRKSKQLLLAGRGELRHLAKLFMQPAAKLHLQSRGIAIGHLAGLFLRQGATPAAAGVRPMRGSDGPAVHSDHVQGLGQAETFVGRLVDLAKEIGDGGHMPTSAAC